MKKRYRLIILVLILSIISGCTSSNNPPSPDNSNQNNGQEDSNGLKDDGNTPEAIVTEEIPETFPTETVPLYDADKIRGVVTTGEEYYQAYYYSLAERDVLLEKYKEFYKDSGFNVSENQSFYELSGTFEEFTVRMYLLPFDPEHEENVTGDYKTTVIVFVYSNDLITPR